MLLVPAGVHSISQSAGGTVIPRRSGGCGKCGRQPLDTLHPASALRGMSSAMARLLSGAGGGKYLVPMTRGISLNRFTLIQPFTGG